MFQRPGITCTLCLVLGLLLLCISISGCGRQIVIPSCEYTGHCVFEDPLGDKTEEQQRILSVADVARDYYEARKKGEWQEAQRLEQELRNANVKTVSDKYWHEIHAGQVVAGMSPVEVLCAWGQPEFAGEEVFPSFGFFDYLACGDANDESIPLKGGRVLPPPDIKSYIELKMEIEYLFAQGSLYFTKEKRKRGEPPLPVPKTVAMADGYITYQKGGSKGFRMGSKKYKEWIIKIVFSSTKGCYTQRVRFKDTVIGSWVKDIVYAVGDQRHLRPFKPIEGEDVKLPAAQNHKLKCIVEFK